METSTRNIFAIGDVAGVPCLAHKASAEGKNVAEIIAGRNSYETRKAAIPTVIFSNPEVASVGLTEEQAVERGGARVGRFPMAANGKAKVIGEPEGFVKTIFCAITGELLGAHMVGFGVTELIHGFSLAMTLETTESELMETIFPHPTLSEAMHESVLAAFDGALNA